MFRFTIRDVLWLTVVVGMGVGWRSDLARQEAIYRDMLKTQVALSGEMREIATKARNNPELRAEFKAYLAAESKYAKALVAERRGLHRRYKALKAKAHEIHDANVP